MLFRFVFSRILTEYGEIRSLSPYSVWMRENTDQNNSEYDHFSRSAILRIFDIIEYHLMLNPQLNLKSFKNIYQNKDSPEKIECIWSKLFSFLNQSWRESFIKWPLHISSEWIITSVIIWGSDFGVTYMRWLNYLVLSITFISLILRGEHFFLSWKMITVFFECTRWLEFKEFEQFCRSTFILKLSTIYPFKVLSSQLVGMIRTVEPITERYWA